MFVRGAKLAFDAARKWAVRKFVHRGISFTTYDEFYCLDEAVRISGTLLWVGETTYITESLPIHARGQYRRSYFIHYDDMIVIRHRADQRISHQVLKAIDHGHNVRAIQYLTWLHQKARASFIYHKADIVNQIISGAHPMLNDTYSETYITIDLDGYIAAAIPGSRFLSLPDQTSS